HWLASLAAGRAPSEGDHVVRQARKPVGDAIERPRGRAWRTGEQRDRNEPLAEDGHLLEPDVDEQTPDECGSERTNVSEVVPVPGLVVERVGVPPRQDADS